MNPIVTFIIILCSTRVARTVTVSASIRSHFDASHMVGMARYLYMYKTASDYSIDQH